MHETVTLTRRDGAAWIELNRPDALNAFDQQLVAGLRAAVEEVAGDDEVRAVVLTGAGRAFSSGADLKQGFVAGDDGRPDVRTALEEGYHPIITGLRRMPKPVIAAVNGPAVGIGCSMALACDLVVAKESAYLLLAFVNIGLVPDGGSSLFIPARAGFTRAAEMALMGERIPARQALEWNLVNRVVADDEFDAAVEQLAARFAAGPTRSYAASKRQLNASIYPHLDEQLSLEAHTQQEMAASDDFGEGVTAFVEKRAARFRGR